MLYALRKPAAPPPGAARPARPRPAAALCAGLLAALACTVGCATGRVNLWPFYFHEVRQVQTPSGPQTVTTTEVLYPFFHRESGPDGSWHALRPFYNYEPGPGPGQYRIQYLWPLGLHARDGGEVHHRFFLLFEYNKTFSKAHNKYALHAHVVQLLRWGSDPQEGFYFALFPIAGITHGVIGRTWSFVMFPLYSHYERLDYVRDDFPWPILGYGRSESGTRKMYRAWPFFVYQREDSSAGIYERYDAPWPLVRWGTLDRGGKYYHRVLVVAPVFSTIATYDREGKLAARRYSILGFGAGKEPGEDGESGVWGLWSLFKKSSDPKTDEVRFIPFYWRTTHYRTAEKKPEESWTRWRVPWPLVWIDTDRLTEPGAHHKAVTVTPFYWQRTRSAPGPESTVQTSRSITLWPLVTWASEPGGGFHVWLLSHGWKDETKGFKRNYRAFLDFFQYHRAPDGEKETRVLSRLYHHRRGGQGRYLSVMGLFTYDSTGEVVGEDGKYFDALFGLVKKSWSEGASRWRIFYIPLGGRARPAAEEGDAGVP